MINKEKVKSIVEDYLGEGEIFLVAVRVSTQNSIRVFLDGDNGVTIDDCIKLSRHIEMQFDRDTEDYDLEVSSVGVGHPLLQKRQYINNIGRRLDITTTDSQRIKGRLVEVQEQGVVIEKDKPEKGKKKKKEPDTDTDSRVSLPFENIDEAKVQVSFK
jgi:ribosome maturation factor RimP